MTESNMPPLAISVELGALLYETVILISSVQVGVEVIRKRPDARHLVQPLTILENLATRATEAAVILQDEFFKAFGISGVSDAPANDPDGIILTDAGPIDPNDFSGGSSDDDQS